MRISNPCENPTKHNLLNKELSENQPYRCLTCVIDDCSHTQEREKERKKERRINCHSFLKWYKGPYCDKSNDQITPNGCPFLSFLWSEQFLTKWKLGFGGSPNKIIMKIKWGLPNYDYAHNNNDISHGINIKLFLKIMTFLKALQSLPLSQKIITFLHPSYLDFVVANIYIYIYICGLLIVITA